MTTKPMQEKRAVLLMNSEAKYYVKYKLSDGTWSPERQCGYMDWLRYKFDPTCMTRVEE